jgi:anti-sigma regulatory factor (Ser/Thr protein kinase)
MDEVLEAIEEAMSAAGFPGKTKAQVLLAAEEVYCNIAKYAYAKGGGSEIQLSYETTESPLSITIRFLDFGAPFNPLLLKAPNLELDAQDRQIGGLGVYLVKKNMDEVEYDYSNGNNVMTLKKYAENSKR